MVSAVLQLHAKQLYDVLIGLDIYKCCICTPKFNVLVSEPINGSKKKMHIVTPCILEVFD